jgi:hypothetical protein
MHTLTINARALGRKTPLLSDWSVPFPPELGDGGAVTLLDLIARIVRNEVAAFKERQGAQKFLKVLTERQIVQGAEQGAIRSGGSEVPEQYVDPESAIDVALQAFKDGLFLVIIDENELRSLEDKAVIRPGSRITFLRLTLLAGG